MRETTEYTCEQVSEGKLGVQLFVNLSIFNCKIIPDLM